MTSFLKIKIIIIVLLSIFFLSSDTVFTIQTCCVYDDGNDMVGGYVGQSPCQQVGGFSVVETDDSDICNEALSYNGKNKSFMLEWANTLVDYVKEKKIYEQAVTSIANNHCCVPKYAYKDQLGCAPPKKFEDKPKKDFFTMLWTVAQKEPTDPNNITVTDKTLLSDLNIFTNKSYIDNSDLVSCDSGSYALFPISCGSNSYIDKKAIDHPAGEGPLQVPLQQYCQAIKEFYCSCADDFSECSNTKFTNIDICLKNQVGGVNKKCVPVDQQTTCESLVIIKYEGVKFSLPDTKKLDHIGISIQEFIGRVVYTAMGVVGSIALVMMIYGGALWMTAAGNSEKDARALKIMFWAGLGVVIILSSYAVVTFVFNAL